MSNTELRKWRQRIKSAKRHGAFSEFVKRLAENWKSCAIGEKYHLTEDRFSKDKTPKVYSRRADRLGMKFLRAVDADDIKRAEKLLHQIERL